MSDPRVCPRCQAEIPADAPGGDLCPRCLARQGLRSERPTRTATGGKPPPPPDAAEIQPRFSDLEILELIGQGGMGAVYRARQKKLDRIVALKILTDEASRGPAFAERFTREARALARVSHPNIVGVHDFGEADGVYYLTMEYVDGASLRDVLRAGSLSPSEALAIVPQICDALQFAHEEGVVHRDIKPENILLDRKGHVKIADFGLAKMLQRAPGGYSLTASGEVMGTPAYMAPEQIEHPTDVDHRADIYSLGVVFYEMLTGELPLGRFRPPSSKVRVDVRLDEVVLRALAKEPERRYQNASDVKTDVDSIGQGSAPPVAARPSPGRAGGGAGPGTRTVDIRRPFGVTLVAIYLGVLLAISIPVLMRMGILTAQSALLMLPVHRSFSLVVPGFGGGAPWFSYVSWAFGLWYLITAVGLLRLRRWSRPNAIAISALSVLIFFPLSAIPGIAAVAYLLRGDVARIFDLGEGRVELSEDDAARLGRLVR